MLFFFLLVNKELKPNEIKHIRIIEHVNNFFIMNTCLTIVMIR